MAKKEPKTAEEFSAALAEIKALIKAMPKEASEEEATLVLRHIGQLIGRPEDDVQ